MKCLYGLVPAPTVPVALDRDVKMTLSNEERHNLKATLVYEQPVPAPITVGQKIGVLRIEVPGMDAQEFPLVATTAVDRVGPVSRIFVALRTLITGHS